MQLTPISPRRPGETELGHARRVIDTQAADLTAALAIIAEQEAQIIQLAEEAMGADN